MNSIAEAGTSACESKRIARSCSVLLVGPLPPPSGGMANQTRQLARLLEDEGCRVGIVQVNAPYRPAWVGRIRGVRAVFRLVPYVVRLWRDAGRADLIHVMANSGWAWYFFAAPAIGIGRLLGKPVVVNYRGGDADAFFARQFRWVQPMLRRASRIIVPSGFLAAVFAKYGVASTQVPNIVNLEAFQPALSRPATPHLLITRNLEPIYDIATTIRAFAIIAQQHRNARLTVAGSGPGRHGLEQLARDLEVSDLVQFTGRLDNAALPDLYRAASVVVNSSLVDNMPISLLEAMASGVPIVSTNVGGIPYLVENEKTALLVPPGDPAAMAAATLRLILDPQLANRLQSAAQEAVRRYAWPSVREQLFDIYAQALGRAPLHRCRA
jgi:L-malate glycosyltransferase